MVEVDFGATLDQASRTFTVVDAAITAAHHIIIQQSSETPTGKDADETEFDVLQCRAVPGAGQFDVIVYSFYGSVTGNFKLTYTASL